MQRVGLSVEKSNTRSWGYAASGNYFDALGLQPVLGRFFHATDEHGPASAPFIVLSYDFWHRQFNASPDVLGQTIQLNQHPFAIIGVSPEGFHGTDDFFWPDYWFPLLNAAQVTGGDDLPWRDHYAFDVMGRLKPGVTPHQATDSLNALATQMAKEDRKDDGLSATVIQAGPNGKTDNPMKKALLGIMLLALLVLLAACVNLASIFAARAADRSGELAIRMAIGSSRWHILRQLLTEAVLISIAGGIAGTFFARLLLSALSHWQPFGDFPTHFLVSPDHRVYFVAMALSIICGFLVGLIPARQIWNTDVLQTIKTGTLQSETFRGFALRDILLVVQIAVGTLLVTASLVAVRGMRRTLQVPLGFQPNNVTLAQTDLRMAGYTGEQSVPLLKRMIDAGQFGAHDLLLRGRGRGLCPQCCQPTYRSSHAAADHWTLQSRLLGIKWQDWIAPRGRTIVHRECLQGQHNVMLHSVAAFHCNQHWERMVFATVMSDLPKGVGFLLRNFLGPLVEPPIIAVLERYRVFEHTSAHICSSHRLALTSDTSSHSCSLASLLLS
jgi:predicted permease